MEQIGTLFGVGLMAVILVLVALLLAGIGWYQGRGARAAKSWSETQGEVMEGAVEKYLTSSSEGGTMTAYRARIIYAYRLNGRDYVGDRLNFGGEVHSSIKSLAENKVKQFPTGAKVTVFYDPQNPNEAALERSAPASRLMYVIAAVMLVGALATCVFGVGMNSIFGGF